MRIAPPPVFADLPRQGDNHMVRLDDASQNSKQFVADAAHELRTPLTVLRGELEHLVQDPLLRVEHRDRLGSLLEEVERLSKIVAGILALSRLDAGDALKEWGMLDLGQLAVTTAEQIALLAEDKNISITLTSAPCVPVRGNRARLKEVVLNLLDNAIKYTPNGGEIHLKVEANHTHALLEIADTGIGIPAKALPHVFDRFYRVDQARLLDPDGTGLGLAVVKSICNAHGGLVDVQSVVGRGSRFRVTMPLAVEDNSVLENSPRPEQSQFAERHSLSLILESMGPRVSRVAGLIILSLLTTPSAIAQHGMMGA